MNISEINQKITIQHSHSICDNIGNISFQWTDYYSCFANVCEKSGEENVKGDILESETITFSIRYCKLLSFLSPISFRVIFQHKIYNIRSIDFMNYKHKTIKIKCTLERAYS